MASAETPILDLYKLMAWFEANRKQATWGAAGVALVVMIIGFVVWQRDEKEAKASIEVSKVSLPTAAGGGSMGAATADAYLKVAAEYPDSKAAARAVLLAAGSFFGEGQWDQARLTFEKFTWEHRESPFMGSALLGIAASYDAQGKTNEAMTAYKDLVDRHPGENVVPQAKFALARLFEMQNMIEQARSLYEEVARPEAGNSLSSEAGILLEELRPRNLEPASLMFSERRASIVNCFIASVRRGISQ